MEKDTLVSYLNDYLRIEEIKDKCQNGLTVEGPNEVKKVAFAVDSCLAAFEQAIDNGSQLLIVHHGLFWDRPYRLVGPLFNRIKTLVEGGCGLFAVHLPLDLHPEVGNNMELFRLLELKEPRYFAEIDGNKIGVGGVLDPPLSLEKLTERLSQITGESSLLVQPYGPEKAQLVGCISGFAVDLIDEVGMAGYDTFITGETQHAYFHHASEWGINIIYGGHYGTETLGLKALASHLEEKYDVETTFLDVPTGM